MDINAEVYEWVTDTAATCDMTATGAVNAILFAAYRTGQVTTLIEHSLNHDHIKRRNRPQKKVWDHITRGTYRYGDYTLTRTGRGGRNASKGDGWYLEGPGMKRVNLGLMLGLAQRAATESIQRKLSA